MGRRLALFFTRTDPDADYFRLHEFSRGVEDYAAGVGLGDCQPPRSLKLPKGLWELEDIKTDLHQPIPGAYCGIPSCKRAFHVGQFYCHECDAAIEYQSWDHNLNVDAFEAIQGMWEDEVQRRGGQAPAVG